MICILLAGNAVPMQASIRWKFWKKKKPVAAAVDTTAKKSKYDELLKGKHQTAEGMITLHEVKGKLYFELPLSMLGREMLIGSTVSQISDNGNAIVGSKPMRPLYVKFTKDKTHVQLRELNASYITADTAIDRALEKNSIGSILSNPKILAYNNDSSAVVFEMTDFFVSDNKKMSPFDENSLYSQYFKRTQNFRKEASYISGIKSFSDNVSIKSILSYNYSLSSSTGQEVLKDAPFTVEMTRSIVLLPEKPYRPRMADYRIGIFSTERQKLGEGANTTAPVHYANRWRLEPSDTAAFLRGEKVKPVKPIVFYVDNDLPEKWRKYIKEGVSQWSELFEEIGFLDAVQARDFPVDDPEFDPDNLKYSCIRYAPIGIQNAMGPSWVDPRSGEILNAAVYVYHDVVKLLTRWRFVQTAAADESVRCKDLPDEVLGDALRYVISHEVGHCLGFMHDMGASSVIPVDSLRSPSFTSTHGTTESIMDYARFNYVAQPGDKDRGVSLTPPRFGPYDHYLVRWNYTPVMSPANMPEDSIVAREARITSGWITEALKKYPWARYGKQQFDRRFYDPRSQAEDLGDDAISATKYGVANLKYLMSNYCDWIASGDDDYEFRTDMLVGIVNQLATYIFHVSNNVGGLYKNEVKQSDEMPAFEAIPKERQVAALKYLFELYGDLDWLDNKELLGKLAVLGSPADAVRDLLGAYIIASQFSVSQTEGVAGGKFTYRDCADMIFDFVWKPATKGNRLSRPQMDIQSKYVNYLIQAANFPTLKSSDNGLVSFSDDLPNVSMEGCDMFGEAMPHISYDPVSGFGWGERAIFNRGHATPADLYSYLSRARRLIKARVGSTSGETKAHYQLLLRKLDYALK